MLARYWRERQLFSLEQAVHKMTGLTARNFRLVDRGQLKASWFADVVVFDPQRVRDMATYEQPLAASEGIEAVFVNGVLTYRGADAQVRSRAGRLLDRIGGPSGC